MRWPWAKNALTLPGPNVPSDWIDRRLWLEWEPPRNLVAGEASYAKALAALAGPPCESGHCLPSAVVIVRERDNRYDRNAFRAEVRGACVGYLRRHLAAVLAPLLDPADCGAFTVAGLLRGGSRSAPNVGCHVWLGRRLTAGPEITFDDDEYEVAWPPRDDEVYLG
ncbi:MAG TPA: HIRAN domain-containing protein [Solirubrobacteraceae bacterium]|jgi:hypothetical protein